MSETGAFSEIPPASGRNPPWIIGLLFGPPAVWVALRWVLEYLDARGVPPGVLPLQAVGITTGWLQALWPFLVGATVLAALGGLVWRLGLRRMAPFLAAGWLLLWLAGCAHQVMGYLDPRALRPLATETVTVLARVERLPSTRSLGGVELVVRRAPPAAPHRLLVSAAAADGLGAGDRLEFDLVQGRFGGLFVREWRRAGAGNASANPAAR